MGKMSVEGMAAVEKSKSERAEALRALTSKPFNINDEEQLAALKKYVIDFEYNANLMYLFQGMKSGLKFGGGPWLAGFLLPIPEFVNYFLVTYLWCGGMGWMLETFNTTDFHNQLEEMKVIYNWCLKQNQSKYDGATDNTALLSNTTVQHMIRLLAPICPVEFMLVWKKVTVEEETKSSIWSSFSYAYSLFSSPKNNVDLNRLQDLKASVERRELDLGIYKGVESALRYFATDPHFKELLTSRIKQPVDQFKNTITDMLPSMLTMGHTKSE